MTINNVENNIRKYSLLAKHTLLYTLLAEMAPGDIVAYKAAAIKGKGESAGEFDNFYCELYLGREQNGDLCTGCPYTCYHRGEKQDILPCMREGSPFFILFNDGPNLPPQVWSQACLDIAKLHLTKPTRVGGSDQSHTVETTSSRGLPIYVWTAILGSIILATLGIISLFRLL